MFLSSGNMLSSKQLSVLGLLLFFVVAMSEANTVLDEDMTDDTDRGSELTSSTLDNVDNDAGKLLDELAIDPNVRIF